MCVFGKGSSKTTKVLESQECDEAIKVPLSLVAFLICIASVPSRSAARSSLMRSEQEISCSFHGALPTSSVGIFSC